MTEEILALAPMLDICMPALEGAYKVHRLYEMDQDARAATLDQVGTRIKGIATDGSFGVQSDVMAACPNLKMISNFGVGYDAVPIEECIERGIHVTNTPDVLNDAVAELALALMLASCRKIPQGDQYVRQGHWARDGKYVLTGELTGKTVGILGLGRIGKEIAVRCQAMRMRVVYHGRAEQAHQPFPFYEDLEEMAREVEWLVVIAPGTPETEGIVSRKVMTALGPKGCLVNVARGQLVDQSAMVELLTSGELGAAALDVFLDEPNVPEALCALDNVVLSPHQGSATEKTRHQMGDLVVRNLAAFFAGKPLLTPVV